MTPSLSPDQVEQIVQNQHPDLFAVLGCHRVRAAEGDRWVIRTYAPGSVAVWVHYPGERQDYALTAVHHPHFFEGWFEEQPPAHYQLRLEQANGQQQVGYDPYSFPSPQITDFDRHLFQEGHHHRLYEKLGAHPLTLDGIAGVYFAVWAPSARGVSVIGSFNQWQGRLHQMQRDEGGIWELFIPGCGVGDRYQYEIQTAQGQVYRKSDPFGFYQEVRPQTASIVADLDRYTWQDQDWLHQRRNRDPLAQPIAIYEVHLGSWLHCPTDAPPDLPPNSPPDPPFQPVPISGYQPRHRFLSYRELAHRLIPYVCDLGYTHVELMPLAEHPFDGSWGYQVTGYYAPTSRFGDPEGLMYFIDRCHQGGLGVILDWVPGHFSRDEHGLGQFDGTPLYEYADPRKGEQPEWGTFVFDYDKPQVRNFLIANALFWLDKYHADGIRVDAVASMLYLDYGRKAGEWAPNAYGGRENIEAAEFLRQLNQTLFNYFPGILSIAEESTEWPMVSWPTYVGGLGFNLKWNLGWSHDVLDYFQMEPHLRQFHHNNVTFPMWYHHSENFVLVLSHDDVVRGQGSILSRMAGDEWQKFANLRCLCSFLYAHPGKKTTFMGLELGQWEEWNAWGDLNWPLLEQPQHQQFYRFCQDLNRLYRQQPALYGQDFHESGFRWIDCSDNRHSVISFLRRGSPAEQNPDQFVVVVCNFTPQPHAHYRIGVPEFGFYAELFNSDAREYGGSNMGNLGGKWAEEWSFHSQPYSLDLCLPPLGVLLLGLDRDRQPYGASG
ncbi:MAG: 1,4-alpha-glucan branching protein GlgB [Prochlorothrix sp.]|nr:1,4-alpha-glucan branching protein GlgB [Prochlorothrix sp.]